MQISPFNQPGTFWRGNLHTHSTRSDGTRAPEAACAFYRQHGYDFLAITDHFMAEYDWPITDTSACRSAGFTTLLGAELHAGRTSTGEIWHILALGLPADFAPCAPDETGPQLAARAMQAGAFVACAHPNWYALSESDVLALGPVHAIETINGISRDHNDRIDSWYMLDVMLNRGLRYHALTTDDAHFHGKHADLLHAWTWVRSEALEPAALLTALKAGAYYSSSGPRLFDVQIEHDRAWIRCSPVSSVFVTGRGSASVYLHGRGITEAELDLKRLRGSPFCRITVRDDRDGRAWTNPVWFEDVT
jgi:hypothetical protein